MRDLRLVFRLRRRQLRSSVLYWLTLVGYEPGRRGLSARIYDLYLLLFGAAWATGMLAVAFHQAGEFGAALGPTFLAPALAALPTLVLVVQILAVVGALRASPLKLTFADMTHLAGSPLTRTAIALAGFAGQAARNVLVATAVAALVAEALAPLMGPARAGFPALRAAAAVPPLAVLTTGLAWLAGLLRLRWARSGHTRFLWLLPLALLPLARLLPGVLLWPGHILAQAIAAPLPARQAGLLWLLAAGSVGLVAVAGRRVNMIDVCAESQTYARVKALGIMAWLSPDLAQGVRHQASLAGRRPLLRLPRATGAANLVVRGILVYVRRPSPLLVLPLWSGLIAQAAGWLALPGGSASWLSWLLLVLFAPADGLVSVFSADQGEPFLRQLLPVGNLPLLLADTAAPLALVTLGALGIWLWPGRLLWPALAGGVAIVLISLMLILCRGLSRVRIGLLGARVPYQVAVLASFGVVILAGAALEAPLASLGAALAVDLLLAAMIAGSRTVTNR